MRNVYKVLVGSHSEETNHLEDLSIDGRIILEGILKNTSGGYVFWIYLTQCRAGCHEHGKEPLHS